MPVVEGRNPVSTLAREGLQRGACTWAFRKSVPARREPIQVGRLRLRMSAQAAHPVVEIVNDEEEDVRRGGLMGRGETGLAGQTDQHCEREGSYVHNGPSCSITRRRRPGHHVFAGGGRAHPEITARRQPPNPKSETRNPKQTQNPNGSMLQTSQGRVVSVFPRWCFGFVSDFGFRISDLCLMRMVVLQRRTRGGLFAGQML